MSNWNTDNGVVRGKLEKVDDSKEFQLVHALGRDEESFGSGKQKITRQQSYGFTATPPKGSVGVILTLDGFNDQALALNLEHPQYRPKDLGPGQWKLYDMWGAFDHAQESVWTRKVGTSTFECFRNGDVHINRSGA